MTYVFAALAAILIYFSFRSLLGGLEYLQHFRRSLTEGPGEFTPFASVIAPCRGIDQGMAENLRALLIQDYPAYEVIFVVDNKSDAAVPVIEQAAAEFTNCKLVIAPTAARCSQKVENLREAVKFVSDASCVFAFVDSDSRPSASWLRSLVAPLADPKIGAATGYRWFISPEPTLASELRSVWNASVASNLGPNADTNFCWGGAMAIARTTFENLKMRERWEGTLSDDLTVTRVLNEAGLPIVFVPAALSASVENCSFGEMLEFTTRQMKITRVYAARLWVLSFIGSGLYCLVMTAAILIAALYPRNDAIVWISLATLTIVSACSIGKAWLRLKAVKLVLKHHEHQLGRQLLTQLTLWSVTPAIFFYNAVAALFSRQLRWRGTRYVLKSHRETVIIAD
jgi:cellulose synthase/poly-beta-1,6-N-acetylglucosamine synthase-like glycosyltransferase